MFNYVSYSGAYGQQIFSWVNCTKRKLRWTYATATRTSARAPRAKILPLISRGIKKKGKKSVKVRLGGTTEGAGARWCLWNVKHIDPQTHGHAHGHTLKCFLLQLKEQRWKRRRVRKKQNEEGERGGWREGGGALCNVIVHSQSLFTLCHPQTVHYNSNTRLTWSTQH